MVAAETQAPGATEGHTATVAVVLAEGAVGAMVAESELPAQMVEAALFGLTEAKQTAVVVALAATNFDLGFLDTVIAAVSALTAVSVVQTALMTAVVVMLFLAAVIAVGLQWPFGRMPAVPLLEVDLLQPEEWNEKRLKTFQLLMALMQGRLYLLFSDRQWSKHW